MSLEELNNKKITEAIYGSTEVDQTANAGMLNDGQDFELSNKGGGGDRSSGSVVSIVYLDYELSARPIGG